MDVELSEHEKTYADLPEWEKATKVHDWRNHVPEHIREMWFTFTQEQRYALYAWADELAGREEWE